MTTLMELYNLELVVYNITNIGGLENKLKQCSIAQTCYLISITVISFNLN